MEVSEAAGGDWRVIVTSIGTAGAGVIAPLRTVSPLPESELAAALYRAPSELLGGLAHETAERVSALLGSTGLGTAVIHEGEDFPLGDSDHEVALVVNDVSHIGEVLAVIGGDDEKRVVVHSVFLQSPEQPAELLVREGDFRVVEPDDFFDLGVIGGRPRSCRHSQKTGNVSGPRAELLEAFLRWQIRPMGIVEMYEQKLRLAFASP